MESPVFLVSQVPPGLLDIPLTRDLMAWAGWVVCSGQCNSWVTHKFWILSSGVRPIGSEVDALLMPRWWVQTSYEQQWNCQVCSGLLEMPKDHFLKPRITLFVFPVVVLDSKAFFFLVMLRLHCTVKTMNWRTYISVLLFCRLPKHWQSQTCILLKEDAVSMTVERAESHTESWGRHFCHHDKWWWETI